MSEQSSGTVIVVTGPTGVGKSTVSHLLAASFERSAHVKGDDVMASVVSGWVDPNLPEADAQNEAVGGAIAVSAMSFASDGYTAVVDGYFFPDGVAGWAAACAARDLSCQYVLLTADLETCWHRASGRPERRWPLEYEPVAALHARFARLELDAGRVVDATGSPESVCDEVLARLAAGKLAVTTGGTRS
jgi:shikimate kinase